jgi:hypothetical protein
MFSRLPDDPTLTAEQLAERENTEARKRLPEAGDLTSVCRNGRALYFRVSQELGLYAERQYKYLKFDVAGGPLFRFLKLTIVSPILHRLCE